MERDLELERVKARMKELGYNPRSLALAAGCKVDIVRNRLSGKAKNWRQDNHEAIMNVLWPSQKTPLQESDIGLLNVIKAVVQSLINKGILNERDMVPLVNYQMNESWNQPGVSEVLKQFLGFLRSEPSESVTQQLEKPHGPSHRLPKIR